MLFKSFNVVRSIVSVESTGWGHFSSICLFWDGISYSLASLRVTVEPRMTLNFSHYCLCPVWGTGIIEPNSPFMASILLAEQHPSPYRRKLSSGMWPLRKTETRAWSSDHRLDWTSTKTHSTWLLSSRSLSPLVFSSLGNTCQVSPAPCLAPVRFCPDGEGEETPKSIEQSSGDFKIRFFLLLLSNTEPRKLLFIKNEIVMGQWLILIGFRNNSPPRKQVIHFFSRKVFC